MQRTMRLLCVLTLLHIAQVFASSAGVTPWSGRLLLDYFGSLYGGCPQGPQQENTQETMLNGDNWWEKNWGRSDMKWPRRGFKECWENRGDVCALPDQDHVVCLPGSRRGSTISRGWALDPKSQACQPGVHCLYACEPGYYWTAFNQAETSNFDFAHAPQRGHCDGTWDYGTSTQGIYCKEDGTLEMPDQPLCKMGETFVFAENKLDQQVFLCQTVFPGHEIFLIPTLVKPGETVMITTQPITYWGGPTYGKPPHGDIYVSFAGADIMEACTWDGFSPSGAALLPYEIGNGVEDNGAIYSTHYFYQQPNSEVPADMVGYVMDLECESSVDGVCGQRVAHNNVITLVTQKKPPEGTTKVKFVFKKPEMANGMDYKYNDPNRPNMPDPMIITGLMHNSHSHHSSQQSSQSQNSQQTSYQTQSSNGNSYQTSYQNNFQNAQQNAYQSQQQSTYQFDVNYGRKLLGSKRLKAFIENTLTVSIAICGSENGIRVPGMSVGPGEIVQLPEEGSYAVGLRGEGWAACADQSNMPWIINIDDGGDKKTYAFRPHSRTGLLEQTLNYSMQLKCISEEDDCDALSAQSVSIPSDGDGDTEMIFRVKKHTNRDAIEKKSQTYDWGKGITNFITNLMRPTK